MWRIGLLAGTGTGLKRIIPALSTSEVCVVTVVLGHGHERLQAVSRSYPEIVLAATEEEFVSLQALYDVVFIASPPFLHLSHIALASKMGKPMICEKPLVSDRRQLTAFSELINDAPPFMLAHQLRHQAAVSDISLVIDSAEYGPPVAARMQWCFAMDHTAPNAQWKLNPGKAGSNAMFDCGVHAVDLAMLWFGLPSRVGAVGHHIRTDSVLDHVEAILDYPSFSVSVLASQSGSSDCNDLQIVFANSSLRALGLFGERSIRSVQVIERTGITDRAYEPVDLYRAEVESFCRSLEGHEMVGTSAAAAVLTSRVLFACEESLSSGRFVDL